MGICKAVLDKGGLCGGSGIIFSRAAVELLFAEGREAFWHKVYSYPSDLQCDVGTGCLLYDAGVQMSPALAGRTYMFEMGNQKLMDDTEKLLKEDPCVTTQFYFYHIAGSDGVADVIRDIHRTRTENEDKCVHKHIH